MKYRIELTKCRRQLITFILLPFGSYKIVVYILIIRFFGFLGLPYIYQRKLLDQPSINNLKFVKTFIKSNSGVKYSYFTNSIDDLRYSCRANFNDWEFVSRYFFVSIASDCEFILDIGAYTGVYSIETAIHNPYCIINSFEPNPEIFKNLQKNIEANKLGSRVKISQIALGNENRISNLYIPGDQLGSSMATLNSKAPKYYKVYMSTLDEMFLSNDINLIKIDVEGYESEVFLGGQNVLNKFKPIILAEANTQDELRKQQITLSKYGYKDPIHVFPGSKGDKRNFIWFSEKDESKAKSFLNESRAKFSKYQF